MAFFCPHHRLRCILATMRRRTEIAPVVIAALLAGVASASAQSAPLADRLPADTVAYASWQPRLVNPSNPLVALWTDPGFAPARAAVEQRLEQWIQKNSALQGISAHELLALGGHAAMLAGSRRLASGQRSLFFLAQAEDGVGRELLQRLAAAVRAPWRAGLNECGVLVAASTGAEFTDLSARYRCGASPMAALAAASLYQQARAALGQPAAEVYVDLRRAIQPDASRPATGRLRGQLHLERIHAFVGGIGLSGPAAEFRTSALGDTSPGSLLDLFGANGRPSEWTTLRVLPPEASFEVFHLDLAALQRQMGSVSDLVPATPQATRASMLVQGVLTLVQQIFTGEITLAWNHQPRSAAGLILAAVRDRQTLQNLLQTALAPLVVPESTDGDVALYRQSGPRAPAGTVPVWLAVTPTLLVAGRDAEAVRRAASSSLHPSAAPVESNPHVRELESKLPPELLALTYLNLDTMGWTIGPQPAATAPRVDPSVLRRHLHWLGGGAWRDAQGIHGRAWLH
jgi:hypothetical protein